ncbi:MAG: hypothetical protein ACT4NV_02490 [Rhodoferax sp.]
MCGHISKTPLVFFTNLAVWAFGCMLAQIYRVISTGRSPLAKLTVEDQDYLVGLVDQRPLWFVLVGCVLLVAMVAIIGQRSETLFGQLRAQQMLNQVLAESASAFLNFGSLLAAVAFLGSELSYFAGSIACWVAWLVFRPKERTFPTAELM